MDKCGEGKCGYAGYRKFGLAGPFLHGGRNRWSVYMCVARLIRRRCSLVWHGTLPRRDWSPIKVSATFILGQGERLRATTVFFLGIFFFFFDRTWRGSVIERNGGHHASSRFRGVNWVWWCVGSFVGIFLLFFFFKGGSERMNFILNLGIVMVGEWNSKMISSGFKQFWVVWWVVYIHVEKLNLKK